jgi:hypothetical protein
VGPGVFAAYAERRYARKASAQLLALFRSEQREHPQLQGRVLYEAIIARRLGSSPTASAAEIVRRAAESLADWPAARDVKFRDVVHYQIFHEYMHRGDARAGTRTNIGATVARVIPDEL